MRITEQEQEIRKTRMIYAAYDLFCQRGIDGVSVAQIAKAAGVSANSIFRYFSGKAELVQYTQTILWQDIVIKILTGSEKQLAQTKNGFEEITILLSNFKKLYKNHSQFILFASDYKLFLVRNHIKLTVACHDRMMQPIFDTFAAALERGQADGSINNNQSVLVQFGAVWSVVRGFVEEIVIYERILEGSNPWKEQFEMILEHTLEALDTKL